MKTFKDIAGYVLGGVMFVVLIPTTMWLASGMPALEHIGALRASITGVLILGGLALSVWTIVYMRRRGKGNPMDAFDHEIGPRTQHLLTDGPYRINRNPMLTGTFIYLLGYIVWLWTWQALLVWVIFVVIMIVQVLSEEKRLRRDFGEEYEAYCKRTGRFLPFILLALVVIGLAACGKQAQEPQVSKGHLDTYATFPSQFVTPRTIRVWTPSDYDPSQQYDVLYMHDGQMLWDAHVAWNHQEWGVDEAMDSLMALGKIRPTIVVGIDNTENRIGEFCPDDIVQYLPAGTAVYADFEAQGNDYLRFLVEELKPYIDSVYATYPESEHTYVMGSSCGGLISSYALCKYPDVFGGAACLSTHCTLAYPRPDKPDSAIMSAYRSYLQEHLPTPNSRLLYFDDGDQTLDAFYGEAQEAINMMLRSEGWDEIHFMYRFFPGHRHCEDDWQARLDIPLIFLLGESI